MSSDDIAILVDQHRNIEAKTTDAVRDLLDLFVRVGTRIAWIKVETIDRIVLEHHWTLDVIGCVFAVG